MKWFLLHGVAALLVGAFVAVIACAPDASGAMADALNVAFLVIPSALFGIALLDGKVHTND